MFNPLTGCERGKELFSIDMYALRATTIRFVMIYISSYPELRFLGKKN
jgi:hypothetical protein